MNLRVSAPAEGNRPIRTLDRVLSKAGVGSRRDAREVVAEQRVRVNGLVVRDPNQWIDLELDVVTLDGRALESPEPAYWALHKPTGYLTTYRHPTGRATVYDLLPADIGWVFPVGRLDLDSSGLLLMTNDSHFAESIMNPRFHVPKTYRVLTSSPLHELQLDLLRGGLELEDGPVRDAVVDSVVERDGRTSFEITITEGRNRQVRRMVKAVGSHVLELERVAIGSMLLGDQPAGSLRRLDGSEVDALRAAAERRE